MLIFDQLRKNDAQLRLLAWGVLVGMGVLLAGLWYVQIISHRHYDENQKAQSFRTVRIPAIRGKIVDRHGRAVAENQPNYSVSLYLEELRDLFKEEWRRSQPPLVKTSSWVRVFGWDLFRYEKTVPAYKLTVAQKRILAEQSRYRVASNIIQNLSANLREPAALSYDQFVKHYSDQLALPLPIATVSNYAQIARFHEQPNNPRGVDIEMTPLRFYPYRASAAHVVGHLVFNNSSDEGEDSFFNYRLPDYRGQLGIEYYFDQELRGRAGVKSVLVNNLGYRQSENIWVPAEPGKNVVLTLDMEIQQAAEKALQGAMPNVQGAVVVMDPNNGDILALVSAPAYDPNIFIPRLNPAYKDALLDENTKPERNRATQENYRPGSIFKIVVALASLEAGLDPAEKIQNPGYIYVPRRRRPFKDTAPPGEYNFRRAFILSSNTYFITNGLRYGAEGIVKIGQRLHLGERTGLPTRQDSSGAFPSVKQIRTAWSPSSTGNLCIGQGDIDVTPLQMAVMVGAIANGGKVLWPRLVQRIEPQDLASGEAVTHFPPRPPRDDLGVSASTLKIVREAMLADVEDKDEGLGRGAAVPGFRVCGKTGTAQISDEENRIVDHTTWFASYAPYENPRYVVIVMVESGSSGGGTCAPVARKIYTALQDLETRRQNKPAVLAQKN